MLTLTVLAALLLAAATAYATVKAWNALFSCDLLGWLCLSSLADALGGLLSSLVSSLTDN